MRIRTLLSAWPLCALLAACAPQTTPQRPAAGRLEVPAAPAPSALDRLKFSEDDAGHICQVGTASCLSLDSRPFAPCRVIQPCPTEGGAVQAAKAPRQGDQNTPLRE